MKYRIKEENHSDSYQHPLDYEEKESFKINNMKHYTETIPAALAEKLKEKGMSMMPCLNITQTNSFSDDGGIHFYYFPTYADVFDWLMEREVFIEIELEWDFAEEVISDGWEYGVIKKGTIHNRLFSHGRCDSWHEAADAAIEKALTLI